MGLLDFFRGRKSDEAIADLIKQSEKPDAGWFLATDKTGEIIGFKLICENTHVEYLIQGIDFFKNPVFTKCQCKKNHDLNEFLKANAARNQKDVKDGIKRPPLPIHDMELPRRSLVARQPGNRFIEVSGWAEQTGEYDYEPSKIKSVEFMK